MNDNELIYYYRSKDESALELLIKKYDRLIWKLIHSFDLSNYKSDMDDYYQICLIELVKALERYSEKHNASFKTFFYVCARTALLNYITKENAKSYNQIKGALALDSCVCEDGNVYLGEAVGVEYSSNIQLLCADIKIYEKFLKEKCTNVEIIVWKLKSVGYSYKEIEKMTHINKKKIDNTLRKIQRIIKNIR